MHDKPNKLQAELLRRRGLDPKDYVVIRVLYDSVWFKNIHTGYVKIIDKRN